MKNIRLSVPIPPKNNEWLEKERRETGMNKSSIIAFALDTYINQKQAVDVMGQLITKITAIEEAVKIYDKEEKSNG